MISLSLTMMKKLKSTLQHNPFFLVLLPLFFIINGYNQFFGLLTMDILIPNFLVSNLFVLGSYILSVWYFKNNQKASFFTFLLSTFFFTFGFLHDSLKKLTNEATISSYKIIIPVVVIVFLVASRMIKNRYKSFTNSFFFINTLLVIFLLFEGIVYVNNIRLEKKGSYLLDNRFTTANQEYKARAIPDSLKPDIFFLVFDAMPSSKAMKQTWGFDNSRLDSALVRQGFYVAADSKSNYNITMLSVTSCMNMNYYEKDQIFRHGEIGMLQRGSRTIRDNSTTRILQKEGYNIQQFEVLSLYNEKKKASSFFSKLLTNHYLYKTFLGRIYRDMGWQLKKNWIFGPVVEKKEMDGYQQKKKDLLLIKSQIKQACSKNRQLKFIYGHFMIPHGPYIFDSLGNVKKIAEIRSPDTLTRLNIFCEQVKFASETIIELVTYIKQANKKNTVIIIIGDHGYRNATGNGYMIFDNLTAIYFPNQQYESLYKGISPINIFRATFNKSFGANLKLLPDTSIFIPYNIK